jgi:hypothetical protein
MKILSREEAAQQKERISHGLSSRIDYLDDQPEEMARATNWCFKPGVSSRQFAALVYEVAMPILARLTSEQLEILHGMGEGPQMSEESDDDLPF